MARNRIDIDDLRSVVTEAGTADAARKRNTDYLGHRQTTLANLAKSENRKMLWVDPARCRLWEAHDRDYAALNEENCRDLIDGFLSEGKQKFAAVVRPSKEAEYDWEVICGARRHWTATWLRANNHPEFLFLVEPRSLTDEEAFRLSDIENRDRQDLTDYERAVKYRKALKVYSYYTTQKDMAERMRLDEGTISRFIALAELPVEIVDAFTPRELKLEHARLLSPYMKQSAARQAILARAGELAEEQRALAADRQPALPGAQIASWLLESVTPKRKTEAAAEIRGSNGKKLLTVKKARGGVVEVRLMTANGGGKAEYLAAISQLLDEVLAKIGDRQL